MIKNNPLGIRLFLVLFVCSILVGCGDSPKVETPPLYRSGPVQDLTSFPQDLGFFAAQSGLNRQLLSPSAQSLHSRRYLDQFFSAWNVSRPGQGNLDYFRNEIGRSANNRGYAENLLPWDHSRWLAMQSNANLNAAPSMRQAAITVKSANLRLAPTSRPRFSNPLVPGQSYPFDEFQQSALPVGFPLMILHRSLDGAWYYVESAFVPGWIAASEVAFVDDNFQAVWRQYPMAALVKDQAPLRDSQGQTLSLADIGALLPLLRQEGTQTLVYAPVKNAQGWAQAMETSLLSSEAAQFPLAATPGNMAQIGNELLGQAYGWGGLYQDRDCSAMLRDLYTPFGLWLPRNSAAQSQAGQTIALVGSAADKDRQILSQGTPFMTLLHLPGHIGLYIGNYQGQPAYFHNLWGLRTVESDGSSGRYVVGKAVITSTGPGREITILGQPLNERMTVMTILGRN